MATAGTPFEFTVTALDAANNVVAGYSGTVHLSSTDDQAVLPENQTLTNGSGTFSTTLRTAGSQTITATDTVTASITGTASSIDVTPGSPNHLSVTASTTAQSGRAFSLTVTARDAANNVANSYTGTVHISSTDTQAVLPENSTLRRKPNHHGGRHGYGFNHGDFLLDRGQFRPVDSLRHLSSDCC
jgi:hypothetical protein